LSYLLDTCTFLWASLDAQHLSEAVRRILVDAEEVIFLSSVSAAEIATKSSLGKLVLPKPVDAFVAELRATYSFESLPFDELAAVHLARLPWLHHDPFDRMLVGQALAHGLVLLTPDPAISQYPARTLW
jgi:PIN domain nuclease of toxin-antitoxin system